MYEQPPLFLNFKKHLNKILFYLALVCFFFLSLFFFKEVPGQIFNSPDETANFYLAKNFFEKSNFFLASPSGKELPSFLMPRSFLRFGSFLAPGGFLGFPLFTGFLAKIFSFNFLPYFLALFLVLSLLAWRSALKVLFGERLALLSAYLFLIHPVFLYFSPRLFFPNFLFLNFLVFSFYFLIKISSLSEVQLPKEDKTVELETPLSEDKLSKRYFFSFCFGLTLAIAILLRPIEALWFLPIFLIFYLGALKQFKAFSYLLFFLGLILPLSFMFLFQFLTYRNALYSGYLFSLPDQSKSWIKILFPFGFNWRLAFKNWFDYFFALTSWFTIPLLLGLFSCFFRFQNAPLGFRKKISFWLLAFLFVSLWLVSFYGSWQISDRLDRKVSLGVSYTRYFMPLYLLSLPFVALGIFRLKRIFSFLSGFLVSIFIFGLIYFSQAMVFWQGDESQKAILETLKKNLVVRENLLKIVPEKEIVVTDLGDKIFFPYREVVNFERRDAFLKELNKLAQTQSLWYETAFEEAGVLKERELLWQKYSLDIAKVADLGYNHKLFKIEVLK